jgi:hypothetical protein
MKRVLTTYTFTAAAKTLDLSATSGFDIQRLVGVVNITRHVIIYAVGITGKGYSNLSGGNILTLDYDTTSQADADKLMVIYDDLDATSTKPLRIDPVGTTTQPISGTVGVSGTVPVSVSGTPTVSVSGTAPVSGTVGISGTVPISGTVGISGTVPVSIPGTPTTQTAPSTSGGLSVYRDINAGTAGTAFKASAGQLYGYYLANLGTVTNYIKIYDKGSAPGTADTPVMTLAIPGTAAANVSIAPGIQFSSGIGVRVTTGAGDTDATAPAGTTALINIWYK